MGSMRTWAVWVGVVLWSGWAFAQGMRGGGAGGGGETEVIRLAGGRLELPTPRGFELLSRNTESTALSFRSRAADGMPAGAVLAVLTAEPVRGRPTAPAVRARVVEELKAGMEEEARAAGMTVVAAPTEVEDPSVYIKVSDQVRSGGRERLRVRSLRLVGNQVVGLYVVAEHGEARQRAALAATAERDLLQRVAVAQRRPGVRAGAGGTVGEVAVAREARVQFVVPEGYRAELTGAAEGVVAVLTMAASPERRILVTVVPLTLPPGGAVSVELLGLTAERAVELETPRLGLPEPVGAFETAMDSRFIHRARREAGDDLARIVSDTRQRRVGDVVVSVAMACLEEDEDEVAGHADIVAESVGMAAARGR